MRVKTPGRRSSDDRFTSLEDYFTPTTGGYDSGGAIEQARELAEKNSRALGFIIACMVEKDPTLFDRAKNATGAAYDGMLVIE